MKQAVARMEAVLAAKSVMDAAYEAWREAQKVERAARNAATDADTAYETLLSEFDTWARAGAPV